MKILLQSTAFTALAALLLWVAARPTTADPFASTLEGDVLEQYERLSQEADLDLEAMAMFLGTEMVTEWLGVLSRPVSERLASTLKGDDLQRYESLSRLERDTFELIALIERELAMEWLSVGPGPQGQEGRRDWTGLHRPQDSGEGVCARHCAVHTTAARADYRDGGPCPVCATDVSRTRRL